VLGALLGLLHIYALQHVKQLKDCRPSTQTLLSKSHDDHQYRACKPSCHWHAAKDTIE